MRDRRVTWQAKRTSMIHIIRFSNYTSLPVMCRPLVIGCFLFLVLPVSIQAQEDAASDRLVRVTGEATVTVEPDRATVRFGVVTRANTAEQARALNAKAAQSAMNAVREFEIAEEKIRLERLRLQPRRERDPETRTYEEKGFEVIRRVRVELTQLDRLPELVTRVVQRGANRIEDIDYGLVNRSAVRNEVLGDAAQNAREKARRLANSLDAHVGPVREIVEQDFGFDRPQPRVQMQFAKAEGDAAPEPDAFAAGEIEVSARVQVVFDLGSD